MMGTTKFVDLGPNRDMDPEIAAIEQIMEILRFLEPSAQARVLRWASARFLTSEIDEE